MKLRDYFLLGIVVSTVFACTSNDDVPDVHVFTPNATLSLATEVNGKAVSKALDLNIDALTQAENKIYSLHVLVFSGYEDNATFQTEQIVEGTAGQPLTDLVIPDIPVEAGNATILVLANDGIAEGALKSKTLDQVLKETRSLENDYNLSSTGLLMSSALIKTTLDVSKHNIFGSANDFTSGHEPSSLKGAAIELYRHVAQINLKSVKISEDTPGAKFELEKMFVANAKGYTNIASNSTSKGGAVEAESAPADKKLWWYGAYSTDEWNGKYKTTLAANCDLKVDLLSWIPRSGVEITKAAPLISKDTEFSCGKSFYVYENKKNNDTPIGEQTLLVLKGTYTDENGISEEDRYYTIAINEPNKTGSTSSEGNNVVSHNYIKRNYRYNISLTIKSNGSDRPYDPATEACMDIQIKVASWEVVSMDEKLN